MSSRRWAGAVYVVGVLVITLRAGEPDKLGWWLGTLPFIAWIASPILGGLWLWRLVSSEVAKVIYLVLLAIIAFVGFHLQWHTMFIGPSDAQNALILLFVPLCQWGAVGLSFGLSMVLSWWSARE